MAGYDHKYLISVETNKQIPAAYLSKGLPFRMLQYMRNLLGDVGSRGAIVSVYSDTSFGSAASIGKVTFTSSSGVVGATIAGTLVTVTWAVSDAQSMANFVLAVNANPTVSALVDATVDPALASRCLLTTKLPALNTLGQVATPLTLALSGTGVTVTAFTAWTTATANAYSF